MGELDLFLFTFLCVWWLVGGWLVGGRKGEKGELPLSLPSSSLAPEESRREYDWYCCIYHLYQRYFSVGYPFVGGDDGGSGDSSDDLGSSSGGRDGNGDDVNGDDAVVGSGDGSSDDLFLNH